MKKTVLFLAILAAPALQAWDCKFEKQIDQELDLGGSETLRVDAAAGDLEIRGGSGDMAKIRGRVCVSEEEWLDESGVELLLAHRIVPAAVRDPASTADRR